MSHTFRLNGRALNKGVDEVLMLKPVKRAVVGMINWGSAHANHSTTKTYSGGKAVSTHGKTERSRKSSRGHDDAT